MEKITADTSGTQKLYKYTKNNFRSLSLKKSKRNAFTIKTTVS